MSSKQIHEQSAVKHCILLIVKLAFQNFVTEALTKMSHDREALALVLIVSSLLIAGAVSGFLSFRYERTQKNNDGGPSWHLVIAHVTTAGLLLVIGTLMIVATSGLSTMHTGAGAQPYFSWLAVTLYLSLVSYDIYALGKDIETP